jgi:pentose-5-phosphate-3-epimerase
MQIIPTILQSDLEMVKKQVALSQQLPGVELIQIDVQDGQFTSERTVSISDLTEIEYGNLQLDVHLMVDEPMDFLWELIELNEWLPIHSVTAQIEHMSYQADFIDEVAGHNWEVGFSLELYTPFESIDQESLARLDSVQLLAIQAGSQGQPLNDLVYGRLLELQKVLSQCKSVDGLDRKPIEIWVDGGVKPENITKLQQHGVTAVTVGSYLWKSTDSIEAYRQLQALL